MVCTKTAPVHWENPRNFLSVYTLRLRALSADCLSVQFWCLPSLDYRVKKQAETKKVEKCIENFTGNRGRSTGN